MLASAVMVSDSVGFMFLKYNAYILGSFWSGEATEKAILNMFWLEVI
jgi:hypothetical protein